MPPRRLELRLGDMLEAIAQITQDLGDLTAEELAQDGKTTRAILFALIVLGEAAARMPDEFVALHPEIPWPFARDLRNLIVHQYFGVDIARVWDTAHNDLPPLVVSLRAALTTLND